MKSGSTCLSNLCNSLNTEAHGHGMTTNQASQMSIMYILDSGIIAASKCESLLTAMNLGSVVNSLQSWSWSGVCVGGGQLWDESQPQHTHVILGVSSPLGHNWTWSGSIEY